MRKRKVFTIRKKRKIIDRKKRKKSFVYGKNEYSTRYITFIPALDDPWKRSYPILITSNYDIDASL